MKVFVYGTLKRGFGNHRILGDAKFVVTGRTAMSFPFVLLDSGFPVMTPAGCGNMQVRGEVYEFDDDETLQRLDQLEGEGRMYDRVLIDVLGDDGEMHQVQTYVGCAGRFGHCSLGVHWMGDDGVFYYAGYRDYQRKQKEEAYELR